jgi:maltooligosyltrehalose trehalohydrolase
MPEGRQIAQGMIGAEVGPHGVHYRVWAPDALKAAVRVDRGADGRTIGLRSEGDGYWSDTDPNGAAGDLYRFSLDDAGLLPDAASRFQPEGIEGPSECIDPTNYTWECTSWQRPAWRGQTTYEIHIGAMTPEGLFQSAIQRLGEIRRLGVEAIEIMPLADFAGNRNWGYDGVSLFAPARCYGRPDDLRALVDAAHRHGLAVILDVVYNHVGPQGGYFARYCADYFRSEGDTPWGRSFNLDGPRSGPVRDFLRANAAYWLDEFRMDGLRLDATHAIVDASPNHLINDIVEIAHSRGAFVVAEDERNTARLLRTTDGGGIGVDAVWADDFHHQVRVALTGTRTSYYSGFEGKASDIADAIQHGWTFRGQGFRPWNGRARGEPCDFLPPEAFVYCIENHDQIGNRVLGERLEHLVAPARFRAASMLLCLGPHAVLIFMGQDWAASAPFLFFCNHGGELGRNISKGRQREHGDGDSQNGEQLPDPEDLATFARSKLSWDELSESTHNATRALYQACLRERHALGSLGALSRESWVAKSEGPLVAVRYRVAETEKLLLVNLQDRSVFPEGLPDSLGARAGRSWHVVLDSESAEFGGSAATAGDKWTLHGPGALWLEARTKDSNASH